MILPFKERFVQPILDGIKVHTFRPDRHHRWREGMKVHAVVHCRTKDQRTFYESVCSHVSRVKLYVSSDTKHVAIYRYAGGWIDEETFAINDGFKNIAEVHDALVEMYPQCTNGVPLEGKIIWFGNYPFTKY